MVIEPEQVKSIFAAAVEGVAPAEWQRFVDEQCGGNADLRKRVEQLLQAHVGEDSLLSAHPDEIHATTALPDRHQPGTQIGPYKLLEQIGEGGMGLVYMAEQQQPLKRLVAIKIIKPGMDSRQVIARFEAERQALALMEHPNIARILDAGTVGERSEVRSRKSARTSQTVTFRPLTSDL